MRRRRLEWGPLGGGGGGGGGGIDRRPGARGRRGQGRDGPISCPRGSATGAHIKLGPSPCRAPGTSRWRLKLQPPRAHAPARPTWTRRATRLFAHSLSRRRPQPTAVRQKDRLTERPTDRRTAPPGREHAPPPRFPPICSLPSGRRNICCLSHFCAKLFMSL